MISRPGPSGRPYGTAVVAGALLASTVGLLVVAIGPWRLGTAVVGSALIFAALARLLLPDRHAGLLRIRRTGSDVLAMTALGVAIVLLAVLVPDQPRV